MIRTIRAASAGIKQTPKKRSCHSLSYQIHSYLVLLLAYNSFCTIGATEAWSMLGATEAHGK